MLPTVMLSHDRHVGAIELAFKLQVGRKWRRYGPPRHPLRQQHTIEENMEDYRPARMKHREVLVAILACTLLFFMQFSLVR